MTILLPSQLTQKMAPSLSILDIQTLCAQEQLEQLQIMLL